MPAALGENDCQHATRTLRRGQPLARRDASHSDNEKAVSIPLGNSLKATKQHPSLNTCRSDRRFSRHAGGQ
jgi:hypothetical protein